MEEDVKVTSAKYQQIAVDIAGKIVDKRYAVGEKVYSRSAIASQYAVSPETARRAIAILTDLGIVETTKGSGVKIRSYENALNYVNQYRETSTLAEYKKSVLKQAAELAKNSMELKETVSRLVERTNQFRFMNPFTPFETIISADAACIGLSLSDLHFWQRTNATVVAVQRKESLIVSPGPYEVLQDGDILYYVGDESSMQRVNSLLQEPHTDNAIGL